VALAPAGGWSGGGGMSDELAAYFNQLRSMVLAAIPHLDEIVATPEGRRMATQLIVEHYEHIPSELIAHQVMGVARCEAAERLVEAGQEIEWRLDLEKITCPVRIVWGTEDRILPWPSAAGRFLAPDFPAEDRIELEHVGHCPQLDVPLEAAELIRSFAST
jgi:pimeloyl-ACP methyl ester carboxylesterase